MFEIITSCEIVSTQSRLPIKIIISIYNNMYFIANVLYWKREVDWTNPIDTVVKLCNEDIIGFSEEEVFNRAKDFVATEMDYYGEFRFVSNLIDKLREILTYVENEYNRTTADIETEEDLPDLAPHEEVRLQKKKEHAIELIRRKYLLNFCINRAIQN